MCVCVWRGQRIGTVLFEVSGIHWGSWTVVPVDKRGPLYERAYLVGYSVHAALY